MGLIWNTSIALSQPAYLGTGSINPIELPWCIEKSPGAADAAPGDSVHHFNSAAAD
jgi:hypothetical protein